MLLLLGSATALVLALTGNAPAHWFAFGFALAAIAVLAVLIHRMRRRLRFVRHLRDWAERMRGGDLSTKIPLSAEADLDEVIEDINSLGGMLEKLAHEMDAQSHAQTVRLARKTQSLDILYETAFGLTRPGNLDQQLEGFLDTFIELVDARAATVHLLGNDGRMQLIAGRRFDAAASGLGETLATHCPHCGWTLTDGGVHILTGSLGCVRQRKARTALDHREVAVVPVQYQSRTLGVYTLYLDWPVSVLGEDVLELLTSIGRHLGLAIEKARLDSDARQLAIMEERNMIGNELHDSLAQSLVSMRLRMKMLGEILHKKDMRAAQNEVRQLRESLDQAHDSLRELLANFRLKIDERGLVPAIETMVQRFSAETGISVFFHNECREPVFSPQQEIQVYHIIQEALSNIRKHSHAHTARIRIDSDHDGRYTVLIEDDGHGMEPATTPGMDDSRDGGGRAASGIAAGEAEQRREQLPSDGRPGEHIGLSVMRERARRLSGELNIESETGEGTRVLLSFSTSEPAPPTRAAKG